MGVILDSSVVILAERRGDSIAKFLAEVTAISGDQEAALSSVGLTEFVHGMYRAKTLKSFLAEGSFFASCWKQ